MTTVQITLPDELAQEAASASLQAAEAMEAMPREQLRRRRRPRMCSADAAQVQRGGHNGQPR